MLQHTKFLCMSLTIESQGLDLRVSWAVDCENRYALVVQVSSDAAQQALLSQRTRCSSCFQTREALFSLRELASLAAGLTPATPNPHFNSAPPPSHSRSAPSACSALFCGKMDFNRCEQWKLILLPLLKSSYYEHLDEARRLGRLWLRAASKGPGFD